MSAPKKATSSTDESDKPMPLGPYRGSRRSDVSPDEELDRTIAEYVRIGLPLVIGVLVILAGVFVDAPTALLVAAAGALIAVIAVFWSSLRTLLGETSLSGADAYVFSAPPRVEEEQKRAVLRALKDIEFERNVGKISEEDYTQLAAKYRAEAKRLLQAIDEKSKAGRERAETLVQKKLRQAGLVFNASDTAAVEMLDESTDETNADKQGSEKGPSAESAVAAVAMIAATKRPSKKKQKKANEKPAFEPVDDSTSTNPCGHCGAANDPDAMFCKKCGSRIGKLRDVKEAQSEIDEEADA